MKESMWQRVQSVIPANWNNKKGLYHWGTLTTDKHKMAHKQLTLGHSETSKMNPPTNWINNSNILYYHEASMIQYQYATDFYPKEAAA